MIAFVVIFDDDLPVGIDIIADRACGLEPLKRVVRKSAWRLAQQVIKGAKRQIAGIRGKLEKEKPTPGADTYGIETEL